MITSQDMYLLKQKHKTLNVKIEILNNFKQIINVIEGITDIGQMTIDAESEIRRNITLTLIVKKQLYNLSNSAVYWLDKDIKLYIGFNSYATKDIIWYKQGYFTFVDATASYSGQDKKLTFTANDCTVKMNGSKNGILGSPLKIPCYYTNYSVDYYFSDSVINNNNYIIYNSSIKEYKNGLIIALMCHMENISTSTLTINNLPATSLFDENSNPLANSTLKYKHSYGFRYENGKFIFLGEYFYYNQIKTVLTQLLKQRTLFTDYLIDEIGTYYGLEENNYDYINYRINNPTWNCIPYDMEFSIGDNVLNVVNEMVNLYPNYELFFDIDNVFRVQMIPSGHDETTVLTNDIIQQILIDENISVNFTDVKNVCEVWGKEYEVSYYIDEDCLTIDNVYTVKADESYTYYSQNEIIAIKVDSHNTSNMMININNLGNCTIFDIVTNQAIKVNKLQKGNAYVFQCGTLFIDGISTTVFYLLGQFQAHALDVLLSRIDENYNKEYFEKKYNCSNVNISLAKDSPFTVQKIGEVNDVKSGENFDNISSDSVALENAIYYNKQNSRLLDSITITTLLIPFLDVNWKVSYTPINSTTEAEYIIKNIVHDYAQGTSTISMYKFYPLYEEEV